MALTIVTLQFHYGGALELGVENVETFGCKVNKKDNVDVSSSPHKNRTDVSSSPQIDRVDVSSQPFDENENRDLNQNQSPLVEEQSPAPRVEEQAPAPRVEEYSNFDSLYDVDENIDDLSDLDKELLQARQSNIQEQVKEKVDRVNLDEIPSGPVDPSKDISEDERDPVENDEVVDPAPRKESTKIYFDPTAKKKNVVAGTSAAIAGTNVATSIVVAGTSAASVATVGNAATSDFTNAAIESQSSVNVGPSAGCTPSDTSTTLRGGATLAYKKPRPKKAKTAGYGLLFGSGDSVTERSGNTDRVLHSVTLSSSTPTNIDLGYKPNRLRWKGRVAITQKQL
ncbi:hypothetical protein KY289_013750 [Solanum tuberosum]|nr:hypothetical protein KY289_013750 [Solanum tuberosum]